MAWAAVPAALQAWRGSHVVITTIMFNFIASALLSYLLVNVLKEPGNMTVESRAFGPGAHMPGVHEVLAALGIEWPRSPLNLSVLLALAGGRGWCTCCCGARGRATRCAPSAIAPRGGALRRHPAARARSWSSMALSGALAGLVGINEIAGVHGRLLLDFVVGAGFAGIAVSLIGRNHPVGIVLAALLFGALYQGGAELAFEIPGFSRDMVFTLQGLIVLFSGAMAQVAAPTLARLCAHALARRAWPTAHARPHRWMKSRIGTLLASTLRVATPLILCALAGALAERSGVIDLGLEGKMLLTAFAAGSAARGERLAAAGAAAGAASSASRCRCCTASPASATAATRW